MLNRAEDRFTIWDKRAIRTLAGGHPFLLQVAAAAMWEAYEDGLADMIERRRVVSACLREENVSFFLDTWLQEQELAHLLTKKEREQLGQAARGAVQVLGQGATTLVEAFAKGLGESWAGGA